MKKFLKTTTALAFAALVATSSLMVYGAGNYTLKVNHTDYVDLHEQYVYALLRHTDQKISE